VVVRRVAAAHATLAIQSVPGHRPADVVDDDPRAAGCKQHCVLLAQATASAADHGNLFIEAHVVACHHVTGSSFMP
jgi:hypothetical protein